MVSSRDNIIKSRRLFFALWPDDVVRHDIISRLKRLPQHAMHAKKMQPDNLHLTLHFIGNVEDDMAACLHQAAQTLHCSPFALQLDTTGYFKPPQIFWMGCSQLPEGLRMLHQRLADALLPCGYQPESRPFTPHVTLLRKLCDPGVAVAFQPVHWDVKSFSLIESLSTAEGVLYRPLENYLLQSLDG
jgi:RNA 2',3'-cyclic 3'-phosphodiesterase